MSRLGKRPIPLPEKVKVSAGTNGHLVVEGPKGKLEWNLPEGISITVDNQTVNVTRSDDSRRSKAMHGLARSLISNMIIGVHQGFRRDLEIQGVGFRAALQGKTLNLSLGFSHPVLFEIPPEVKITVSENTKITVEGIDKQLVGQVAANIRALYPPEPYKGKGVRYVGEQVRRKEGKSVQ
jgi:large subunit ribosomal protein L6